MPIMIRFFVFISFCILATCTPRGQLGIVSVDEKSAHIQRIFVATTRQKIGNSYDFNGYRTSTVSYGYYDMSIPQTHKTGKIEWPKAKPNPNTDFVVANAHHYKTKSEFRSGIAKYSKSLDGRNDTVVFIHGFNNNFSESLYRFTQTTVDIGAGGTPILYSWPSTVKSLQYVHDRDSVLFAREGLRELLHQLERTNHGRITLVAHSIGASLLMETLRSLALSKENHILKKIGGVVLISPDIDEGVFEMQLRHLNPIPKPFIIFSGDKDLALKFSSFLTGKRTRLGQITNKEILNRYQVALINLSDFKDGTGLLNHSVAITSPSVISILQKLPKLNEIPSHYDGYELQRKIEELFNNQ